MIAAVITHEVYAKSFLIQMYAEIYFIVPFFTMSTNALLFTMFALRELFVFFNVLFNILCNLSVASAVYALLFMI